MIDRVLNTIKENNMFEKGDKVIVAVSGGPDSMCLLHVLYTLKYELELNIYAAHVNHCLRGDEADKDESYVRSFCNNFNIPFESIKVDINRMAEEKKISHESAGREARYSFFYKLKNELNAQKIAIAHNCNDQAETVLMRIMRGSGLDGLVGIKPVRDKIFVRPIINNSRKEIEEYCEKNNLNPRIDKTNLETIYSRNKIRLELIPYIEKNFNKDIINVLNRLSRTINVDNNYLERIAEEKYKKYCDIHMEKVIISKEVFIENEAILTRVLRKALLKVSGKLSNFEKIHIYDIINIQKQSTGKSINLPNNIIVSNNYGDIYVCKNVESTVNLKKEQYILNQGKNYIEDLNLNINISTISKSENQNLKSNNYCKHFDFDKLQNSNIFVRTRKDGDKFIPLGMRGSKKIKNLFIDLKIPREKRDKIPFICFDNNIAWIVGYRVSDLFKVDNNTKNILQISIEREEKFI